MKDYKAFTAQYRRYMILRLLAGFPEWSGNNDILQMSLVDLGYQCSHEELLEDLAWLEGQKLVRTRELAGFVVATLTRDGGDAEAGRKIVDGLRRPLPGTME